MPRQKKKVWNYFKNKGDGIIECNYCKQIYKFAHVAKMEHHINKCLKCPELMKRTIYEDEVPVFSFFPINAEGDFNTEPGCDSLPASICSTPTSSISRPRSQTSTPIEKKTRLDSFIDRISPDEKENATEALARAIFCSGTPLNIVQHPLWNNFFKIIRPSFVPPTRRTLSSSILNKEYDKVKLQVESTVHNSKNLNLQCDGWTNIRNESIINFVITVPEPLLIEFLPTGANKHTAEYIAEEIIKILLKFGSEKFFVIVGDNAQNMRAAFKIVTSTEGYKHITSIGCIAHLLHLMCKDVIDCKKFHKCIVDGNNIIKSIKRSHRLIAILAEKQKEQEIANQVNNPTQISVSTAIVNQLAGLIPKSYCILKQQCVTFENYTKQFSMSTVVKNANFLIENDSRSCIAKRRYED